MSLRVTVLELPASWGDPRRVLDEVDTLLARGPATDLVLLPETCLTGYVSPERDYDLTPFAEPLAGPTFRAAAALAVSHGVHLVAPLVLHDGRHFFNASVLVDKTGAVVFTYKKRHPWIPETWATPGPDAPPVAVLSGVAVTIAICFDVHFLAQDAAASLRAADLLLFPSAWVDEDDTRVPLLAGLAREFDLHVANANWGPGVVRVHGQGGSCILEPSGAPLASVAPGARRADARIASRLSTPSTG